LITQSQITRFPRSPYFVGSILEESMQNGGYCVIAAWRHSQSTDV